MFTITTLRKIVGATPIW